MAPQQQQQTTAASIFYCCFFCYCYCCCCCFFVFYFLSARVLSPFVAIILGRSSLPIGSEHSTLGTHSVRSVRCARCSMRIAAGGKLTLHIRLQAQKHVQRVAAAGSLCARCSWLSSGFNCLICSACQAFWVSLLRLSPVLWGADLFPDYKFTHTHTHVPRHIHLWLMQHTRKNKWMNRLQTS